MKINLNDCNVLFLAAPRELMDICRRTIRIEMGRERLHRVDELRLPQALKRYLLYK